MTPHLADTPVLTTDRLILRAPRPGDYPLWEPFFLSDRALFIGAGPDKTAGSAWRAFASMIGHWAMHGFGPFVLERRDTGLAAGSCGPWFPALWPEHEIGWTVWDPDAEGTGLMSEAARRILSHAFSDLGWSTAVSYIDPKNARSIALAERLGAVLDPEAEHPGETALVYRHPAPGAAP